MKRVKLVHFVALLLKMDTGRLKSRCCENISLNYIFTLISNCVPYTKSFFSLVFLTCNLYSWVSSHWRNNGDEYGLTFADFLNEYVDFIDFGFDWYFIHDQLNIRPYFLPWVLKNRRYRILNGIDRIGDFLKIIEPRSLKFGRRI